MIDQGIIDQLVNQPNEEVVRGWLDYLMERLEEKVRADERGAMKRYLKRLQIANSQHVIGTILTDEMIESAISADPNAPVPVIGKRKRVRA